MHVACYRGPSLRTAIGSDERRLAKHSLRVSAQKRMGRSRGWAKIHSEEADGAINLEWDSAGSVLICRIVTKGGDPGPIFGAFQAYLLSNFRSRIQSIHVVPVRGK